MKLQKLFVILLALLVVFSFAACDGSSSGSDDNGGGNGGSTDPTPTPVVTWPVSYQCDISGMTGTPGDFAYMDFNEDGTYVFGQGSVSGKTPVPNYKGTYTGVDPHNDGIIRVTGKWDKGDGEGPVNVVDYPVTITSGSFSYTEVPLNLTRQ